LEASSNFSRDKPLPDVTREVLASISETTLLGTSAIFPTVFPVFWESRGKICYLIKIRAVKRYLSYKVVQAYLQGSPRADPCRLPQEASRLLPPLETCRFRHPLGPPHCPFRNLARRIQKHSVGHGLRILSTYIRSVRGLLLHRFGDRGFSLHVSLQDYIAEKTK